MTLPIEQHWRTVNGAFADSLGNIWNYSYAEANWWDGLKPGYSPGVLQSRTAASDPGNCDPTIYGGEFNGKVLTRLTFTSPDATEYELVDALTNGAPHFFGQCGSQTFSRGRVFVSHDGADLTFIADQPVTENNTTWGIGVVSGVLMFPDGSQYRVDGGLVTSIRDRNGSTVPP